MSKQSSLITINNDDTGLAFLFDRGEGKEPVRYSVDEGDERESLNILPDFEGEVSVIFPAGAWVTLEGGRLVVKFANYGDRNSFDVLPYDYVG